MFALREDGADSSYEKRLIDLSGEFLVSFGNVLKGLIQNLQHFDHTFAVVQPTRCINIILGLVEEQHDYYVQDGLIGENSEQSLLHGIREIQDWLQFHFYQKGSQQTPIARNILPPKSTVKSLRDVFLHHYVLVHVIAPFD